MTALSFIDEESSSRRNRRAICAVVLALLPTIILLTVALLLASRRLAGALTVPPDTATAAFLALVVIGYDAASRVFVGRMFSAHALDMRYVWPLVYGLDPLVRFLAITIAGVSLILPDTSSAATALICLPLVCHAFAPPLVRSVSSWFRPTTIDDSPKPTRGIDENSRSPARRLRTQTTRFVDAAGRDVIEGTAVAEFAPGQRLVSLHLAFCPPFAQAPEIACGAASETAAEVKVVQALAYAARFDVKLAAVAATPQEVSVSFSARCAE